MKHKFEEALGVFLRHSTPFSFESTGIAFEWFQLANVQADLHAVRLTWKQHRYFFFCYHLIVFGVVSSLEMIGELFRALAE